MEHGTTISTDVITDTSESHGRTTHPDVAPSPDVNLEAKDEASRAPASPRTRQLGLPFDDELVAQVTLPALPGEISFASPEVQLQRRAELLGAGALVVTVAPADRAAPEPGRLGEHVDERIERELAARGAPSPYLASWSAMPGDVEARLADQLFRARSVGATGIALLFGPLVRASDADAPLGLEDSATLRVLARSAADRPLVVLLDDADRQLRAYEAPVPVAHWMRTAEAATSGVRALQHDALETTAKTDELPPVSHAPASDGFELDLVADRGSAKLTLPPGIAAVLVREDGVEWVAATDLPPVSEAEAPPSAEADGLEELASDELDDDDEILGEVLEDEPALAEPESLTERAPPVVEIEQVAASRVAVPVAAGKAPTAPPPTMPTREDRATVGIPVARAASDGWRAWALALSATRGPQPLGAFEKLFVESYMPLANAIAEGLDDPRALRAHDEFRVAFERAYLDASATFGVTTRRPRMVMDAFDLALKHARAHNARSTHVLLVDSLRADVAVHAKDAITRLADGRMSLTSEALLWSAMPTTTVRQLETLARGVDALRAPSPSEPPPESLRGRTAEHARRLRVGSRELFKLDVVPALLAQVTTARPSLTELHPITAALPRIGEAVGDAIVRHAASLPARTMLYVVGDHGFTLDRRGRLDHGGASPEEVLVPAQAWLVGELH